VETRLLILNADPVFQDKALSIFDMMDEVETRIVRTLSEAVLALLSENFDAFVVEGEPELALEQATNARQHFPSLKILGLVPEPSGEKAAHIPEQQNIILIFSGQGERGLERELKDFVRSLEKPSGTPAEGIDPCHSLIGNLNQFTAAEILQMSCLSQRAAATAKSICSTGPCATRLLDRSRANRLWRRFSGGGRGGFTLKRGSSPRCKQLTVHGRIS
jgi:hypothetical protein